MSLEAIAAAYVISHSVTTIARAYKRQFEIRNRFIDPYPDMTELRIMLHNCRRRITRLETVAYSALVTVSIIGIYDMLTS